MNDLDHPESFENFVLGRLSDQENESIIAHLVSCEVCAAKVERLWLDAPIGKSIPTVIGTDMQDTIESERSLFRKIHRSDLGGQVVRLYTQGFISLLTGMFRPIVSSFRASRPRGGK
jgi:hypothetical protein